MNSAVATAKGAKELYENRKEVYASVKDFAGKLTSKDDKVRDYAVGQAKAYTMSAVLGGAASKALGSRLPKPKVDVPGSSGSVGGNFQKVIHVTKDGIALPANSKYKIPDKYLENKHRTGSYGEIENGKFKEKLRIDPATKPGDKGPNYSHYHLDGKGTHYSPRPNDKDSGFSK